jgi:hypothetical protein
MVEANHAFARVILLTKDEHDMIADCLEYYSEMLEGRGNVVVIDNGSTHPKVLLEYAKHTQLGGHVVVEHRSFQNATQFMSEHMRQWATTCDWLLPMETDEIVFDLRDLIRAQDGSKPPLCVRPADTGRALTRHLEAMSKDVGVVKYGKLLASLTDPAEDGYHGGAYSRPILQMTRFYNQGWDKFLVRSVAFDNMVVWCHNANLKPGFVTSTSDRLGVLHFHDTGIRRQVERAIPVVQAYGYIDCANTTPEQQLANAMRLRDAPIMCGHKVRYLADHLMRRATLAAFRRYLGRLPCDAVEMDRYARDTTRHPAGKVCSDLASGQIRRVGRVGGASGNKGPTLEEMLYTERRQEAPKHNVAAEADDRVYRFRVETKKAPVKLLPTWITGLV